MKTALLGSIGVCFVLLACDKAPDVNAKGELRANPTVAAEERKAAAIAPPTANGPEMKVSTGLEQKGVSTGLEQKVAPAPIDWKGPAPVVTQQKIVSPR